MVARAQRGEEVLDGFEDESEQFVDRADGYAAAAQRRRIDEIEARLAQYGQRWRE